MKEKTIVAFIVDWIVDWIKRNGTFIKNEIEKRKFLSLVIALGLAIFLFLFFTFLVKAGWFSLAKDTLICPVRGAIAASKYDANGRYSEEYQRINLIKSLIRREGYSKKQFFIEFPIRIGHKGKNSLRPDIVIKSRDGKQVILVVEVKKDYDKKLRYSAIHHQLIPAMLLLNCKKGIYYDGSINSCYVIKKNDDLFTENKFFI